DAPARVLAAAAPRRRTDLLRLNAVLVERALDALEDRDRIGTAEPAAIDLVQHRSAQSSSASSARLPSVIAPSFTDSRIFSASSAGISSSAINLSSSCFSSSD